MQTVTSSNFGLLIAYILPGFTVLWGLSRFSDTLSHWLGVVPTESPTIGGFLYVTLASVAAGLTVSTIRWLVIDTLHHRTGVTPPNWDLTRLEDRIGSFRTFIEHHYRYYQAYGNLLVALVIVLGVRWGSGVEQQPWTGITILALTVLFYLGSRDALKKYYLRVELALQSGK